jgi:Protein of unknown function (DUF2971)
MAQQSIEEQYDALIDEMDKAIQTIHSDHDIWPKPPRMLHHYTTIHGVKGIIENSEIWATEVGYLNDRREIHYGMSMCSRMVTAAPYGLRPLKYFAEFRRNIGAQMIASFETMAFYVSCFCEVPDLLSQWRGYGHSGGFTLNLAADKLIRPSSDPVMLRMTNLQKVIYDPRRQQEILSNIMMCCMEYFKRFLTFVCHEKKGNIVFRSYKHAASYRNLMPKFSSLCAHRIMRPLTLFKHPAFSEEKEWRLVHSRQSTDLERVSFRPSKEWLIPYLSIPINLSESLESVTCGPPASSLSRHSMRTFLQAKGLSGKDVLPASAPLRV